MKNKPKLTKQQIINKWENAITNAEYYGKEKNEQLIDYMKEFISDVKRLDEPDVLSQEWIEKNIIVHEELGAIREVVPISSLQNLIVKSIDNQIVITKPEIPQFVADWLDDNIERYDTVYSFIISLVEVFGDTVPEKIWTYASEHPDIMARAYLDGYTAEKEQKYEVRCKGELLLTYYTNIGEVVSVNRWDNHLSKNAGRDWKLRHELTEQEIKDYDERYWAFAEPVEELEE